MAPVVARTSSEEAQRAVSHRRLIAYFAEHTLCLVGYVTAVDVVTGRRGPAQLLVAHNVYGREEHGEQLAPAALPAAPQLVVDDVAVEAPVVRVPQHNARVGQRDVVLKDGRLQRARLGRQAALGGRRASVVLVRGLQEEAAAV